MVSMICNQIRWPKGFPCITDGGRFRELRTPSIPRTKSAGPWDTQEEKFSRHNPIQWRILQHFLAVQDYSFRESALCSRSSHKGVWKMSTANSGETSPSRHESTRKTPREIQIKQEDLKSLVDIPRLPQASGNRMLHNLKDFNSMPFMSKIEYLRTTAKFYRPIEKGNHDIRTTLQDDGW